MYALKSYVSKTVLWIWENLKIPFFVNFKLYYIMTHYLKSHKGKKKNLLFPKDTILYIGFG